MWSEFGEMAPIRMFPRILKGSSGTLVTSVMTVESAIFLFTWWEAGKEKL